MNINKIFISILEWNEQSKTVVIMPSVRGSLLFKNSSLTREDASGFCLLYVRFFIFLTDDKY